MSLLFLIQRPVAVLTVLVGLLALGAVVSTTLPVSLLPDLSIPQISVQISRTGAGAADLERTVTSALRNQLLQVNRLKDISSSSQDEQATITLDFEFGTNINLAFIEVNEKIDQIISQLPKDLERPTVLKAGVTDIPVFYLAVVPKLGSPLELSNFSKTVLKRRMEQLPQIAFVDRSGYATPQITLQPNAAMMQRLGLTIQDVERLLKENNINFGSVLVQDGQYQYNVRLSNQLGALEDLAALPISHEGQAIPLSKLVSFSLDIQPRRGLFQYNGKEAIVFAIRKQADAQLFDMKKAFAELLDGLEKDYPNLQFHVFNDQSELLEISINNLSTSLGWGGLFAILVMFLAYRGWRAPVLIGLTVPIALVIALLGFYLLDLSINIISLSGLILGVGLMIDNSIIVIGNIYQYRVTGLDWTEACVKGANEVIRPLISSALTTCCVFLPLVFLSGISGALFYDQAMSITIALAASLLVAYLLLPTLLRLMKGKLSDTNLRTTQRLNFFTKSVDVVLRWRWLYLLVFLLLLLGSYFPLQQLTRQTFPTLTRNAYTIKIDWNEPISVEENQMRTTALINKLGTMIKLHASFVGEQQFLLSTTRQAVNQVQIVISISENTVFTPHIIESYLEENHSQAKYEIKPLETIFDQVFGAPKPPLVVHLQSVQGQEAPDVMALTPFLSFLEQQGLSVPLPATQIQYEVRMLREKALLYELPADHIFNALQVVIKNYNIGILKTSSEQIPMIVTGELQSFSKALQTALVTNTQGETIPLSHFIELEKQKLINQFLAEKEELP
ncbi:MAG: efflux RND transporter permease subunit [Saprospiraceae bacterium]|nr:efflux RND transporter permease subunit [Saprospiraceae bacterium]